MEVLMGSSMVMMLARLTMMRDDGRESSSCPSRSPSRNSPRGRTARSATVCRTELPEAQDVRGWRGTHPTRHPLHEDIGAEARELLHAERDHRFLFSNSIFCSSVSTE